MPSVYQENFQQTVGKWLCRVIEFQFTGKCLHDLYPSHGNCLNLIGTEIWLPGIGGPWCFQRRRGEFQRFLFYLHSRNLLPYIELVIEPPWKEWLTDYDICLLFLHFAHAPWNVSIGLGSTLLCQKDESILSGNFEL